MRRSPKIKAVIAAFTWAEELAWTFAFLQKLLNKFTPSLTQAPVRSLKKEDMSSNTFGFSTHRQLDSCIFHISLH